MRRPHPRRSLGEQWLRRIRRPPTRDYPNRDSPGCSNSRCGAAVAAPDVSKPDHKNAELNDSAGRKAAPDEKAAALSLPSAKPQNAADNREIRDVIERYAAAYRMKRIDEIKAVLDLSAAEQRTLSAIFRSNRIEAYRLSPQSDPRVEGDRALVFCERSISQIPTDRTALQRSPQTTNAKTDTVTVRLARTGGTWKIVKS